MRFRELNSLLGRNDFEEASCQTDGKQAGPAFIRRTCIPILER